jgi:hypothetical protein
MYLNNKKMLHNLLKKKKIHAYLSYITTSHMQVLQPSQHMFDGI